MLIVCEGYIPRPSGAIQRVCTLRQIPYQNNHYPVRSADGVLVDCYKDPETGKIIPIPLEYKDKIVKWAPEKCPADDDGELANWSALKLIFGILNPL
jgi:hypothetical protein